jgi:predicted metal-dependent phosphoesterase TrpH
MSPEAMARTAQARGLDGVVITEHDVLWSLEEVAALQAAFPALRIFRGIEVSTAEGHALAYGISDAVAAGFDAQMPLMELTAAVHAAGGVVVLAHPTRYEDEVPDAVTEADLDAVEALSLNVRMYMAEAIDKLQADLGVPGTAGSDAHVTDSLGFYATDFDDAIESERDLAAAIRADAFSLHANQARIAAYNAGVGAEVAQMAQLIQADTLTKEEIKAQYGLNYSFQKGVRRGKDMRLRAGPGI